MTSIALYVEGGGDSATGKQALRTGFDELLVRRTNDARGRRVRWQTTTCGGPNATFDALMNATRKRAADFVVLVVDAEDPVATDDHLSARDGLEAYPSGCRLSALRLIPAAHGIA